MTGHGAIRLLVQAVRTVGCGSQIAPTGISTRPARLAIPNGIKPILELLPRDHRAFRPILLSTRYLAQRVIRVIYYWWVAKDRISLLLIYPKNDHDDLAADQVKQLKNQLMS